MNKKPKISIIVPVYNAEQYIERCMNSIYGQTFNDYEIILVNDGSQDNSLEICRKYQEQDNRVTVIDKKNEGAGTARNAGMKVAQGEYLAFPDVDDWFEPTMYEELYNLAKKGDYDVVFSGVNYYKSTQDGNLEYSHSSYCEKIELENQEECRKSVMTFFPTSTIFDVPWNKLYKRSVVIESNIWFSNMRRCQDAMFNIEFYNCVGRVAALDKAFYNYIENTEEGIQRKFPKNYIDINITYYAKLMEILTNWGVYEEQIKQHYDTTFVMAIYETMAMFENPHWRLDKKAQKQYIKGIMNRDSIRVFLKNADIREDISVQSDILKKQDYVRFILKYKKDKIKKSLRRNKIVIQIYYFVKRKK